MNYLRIIGFLGLVLLFAQCNSKPQSTDVAVNFSKSNVAQSHEAVLKLDTKATKKVDNWQEYRSLNDFLDQYQSISPNEALNNSKELNDLVQSLKDSVKPEFLETNAFKARINLMHNETLRLFDMSFITSIKNEEVNQQVDKVLESFSAVNLKINTILRQKELDFLVSDPKFNRVIGKKDTVPAPAPKKVDYKKQYENNLRLQPKKETAKEKRMRLSKEQRMKRRQQKLQSIQKQQDDKKKKKNQ